WLKIELSHVYYEDSGALDAFFDRLENMSPRDRRGLIDRLIAGKTDVFTIGDKWDSQFEGRSTAQYLQRVKTLQLTGDPDAYLSSKFEEHVTAGEFSTLDGKPVIRGGLHSQEGLDDFLAKRPDLASRVQVTTDPVTSVSRVVLPPEAFTPDHY